jgi:hypothetical protein
MEMQVFLKSPLPELAAIEHAVQSLGVDLHVATTDVNLAQQSGYLPMTLRTGEDAEETGCEVYVEKAADMIEELELEGVDPALDTVVSFRWASDMLEFGVACAFSAAIARLTGGVIYEGEEGKFLTVEETADAARRYIKID